MQRMKIQRTVNKNKEVGIDELGRGKRNINGTDNKKHHGGKRKKRKNPNNRTFQGVEDSGGFNTEKGIKVDGQGKPDENAGKKKDILKKKDNPDLNNLSDIEDSAFEKPKTETYENNN